MKRRQFLRGTLAMVACGFFARRLAVEPEEALSPMQAFVDATRGFGPKAYGADHRFAELPWTAARPIDFEFLKVFLEGKP